MRARTIPLLSLFAAFSFVLMMFNLPLPGGTTGHAVGVGIAAIILGPAASTVAISLALLVQAIFFGDGGITTYGANCFNMAIVGSFASYAVYECVAWRSDLLSKRRVLAAGLAGYTAINAAALCAAIEFGIQPLFFHDAAGAPLYAPYPLHIALPAMMIGHLTIAGGAEFVVAAGLVRYLQVSNASLLMPPGREQATSGTKQSLRGLWAALALLLVLTPLGIIAVGSAWGEWSATDFEEITARREIAAASQNSSLPAGVPAGLRKWSELWGAPVTDYAPAFIQSRSTGYLFSAAAGVGVIVVIVLVISQFWQRRGVVERTLESFLDVADRVFYAEQSWQRQGMLQGLDARVKLVGVFSLVLAAAVAGNLLTLTLLTTTGFLLAVCSGTAIHPFFTRLWLAAFSFTGLIALPAVFLTPGHVLAAWPLLHLSITAEGLRIATLLLLRAEIAATLGSLLVLTTPWNAVLRALRFFHIPPTVIASLGISYRYAFLFVQSARNMLEARQSRSVGRISGAEQRRLTSATMGALLDKVFQFSNEVHLAMLARGFRGEIRIVENPAMQLREWCQMLTVVIAAIAAVWFGRWL